jgi:hypothetical protein
VIPPNAAPALHKTVLKRDYPPLSKEEAQLEWSLLADDLNTANLGRGLTRPGFTCPQVPVPVKPPTGCRQRPESPLQLPDTLNNYTFAEAREIQRALGDGPSMTFWGGVEGEFALRHAIPGQSLQTKFVPSRRLMEFRDWMGKGFGGLSWDLLVAELKQLEFDANLLFGVVLSLGIERGSFTATLDELDRAIGWEPKSRKEREANRLKLWLWLLIFDSMQVIGVRRGTYKDPNTKQKRDLTSDDDLIHISGTRSDVQERLDGVPYEVSLSVGPWIEKLRGDKRVLTYLGDLRTFVAKRRGRFPQRLAVKLGVALQQQWRTKATHDETQVKHTGQDNCLSIRYKPFTRQELMTTYGQESARELEELLCSNDPGHAREYFQEAIKLLQKWKVVGYYRELSALPESRKGWQDFWYKEQLLDIRPAREMAQDIKEVKQAKASADRARKRRAETQEKAGDADQKH